MSRPAAFRSRAICDSFTVPETRTDLIFSLSCMAIPLRYENIFNIYKSPMRKSITIGTRRSCFSTTRKMSTFQFDGHRMDLAEEYRDNLRGPFSLELQQILDRMRTTPMKGRFALTVVEPFKKFALARLSGERGVPPTPVDGVFYHSIR